MLLKKVFSAIMLMVFLIVFSYLILSYADDTKVRLEPSEMDVLPGDSLTINVLVSNVNDLRNWQIVLKYNGTVINCTSVWVPENHVFAAKTSVPVPFVLNEPTIDGYNYALFGNSLLTESVNVSEGLLFKLNFTVQTYGTTPLWIATKESPAQFSNKSWEIFYSILLNTDLQEMPFTTQDGSVQVGPRHTLTLPVSEGGTTNPSPGVHTYTYGENVLVEAIPSNYYVLDNWLLDGEDAGTANPILLPMTENRTLQPIFIKVNFTLTVSDAAGGTTNLFPGAHSFQAEDVAQVFAYANEGYRFDHWILDASSTTFDNPVNIIMDSNHTLQAVFSEVYYTRTIYIRPNGAIDPSEAPISTFDNVTYSFTGTISDSIIVVQKSHITIDGSNHVLQGSGSGEGFSIYGATNVTIRNTNIRGFDRGICLFGSSLNKISGNNITTNKWLGIALYISSNNTIIQNNLTGNNDAGIRLEYSSNWNTIVQNNIASNKWLGIYIDSSSGNSIHHNNWANNTNQAYVADSDHQSSNYWDDSFEGNYWSNFVGPDTDYNGVSDTPFVVDENNIDRYPLLGTLHEFKTSIGFPVSVISNSTIENYEYSEADRKMSFNVKGLNGTVSFCTVIVKHGLMNVSRIQVIIDDGVTPLLFQNFNLRDNGTHRWIYFAFKHSTHKVVIQEDNVSPVILVMSPENKTYSTRSVYLNYTVNEPTSWNGYTLDGTVNMTITGNTTIKNLTDGQHCLIVYANDTVGNMGNSSMLYFTVDATPPSIVAIIQFPDSSNVKFEDHVLVNATVTDEISKVKKVTLAYSCINNADAWNATLEMTNVKGNIWTGNMPALPYGTNVTYEIVAEDYVGNAVSSEKLGITCQYQVVPEFPSALVLWPLMTVLLLLAALLRKTLICQNRQR